MELSTHVQVPNSNSYKVITLKEIYDNHNPSSFLLSFRTDSFIDCHYRKTSARILYRLKSYLNRGRELRSRHLLNYFLSKLSCLAISTKASGLISALLSIRLALSSKKKRKRPCQQPLVQYNLTWRVHTVSSTLTFPS